MLQYSCYGKDWVISTEVDIKKIDPKMKAEYLELERLYGPPDGEYQKEKREMSLYEKAMMDLAKLHFEPICLSLKDIEKGLKIRQAEEGIKKEFNDKYPRKLNINHYYRLSDKYLLERPDIHNNATLQRLILAKFGEDEVMILLYATNAGPDPRMINTKGDDWIHWNTNVFAIAILLRTQKVVTYTYVHRV